MNKYTSILSKSTFCNLLIAFSFTVTSMFSVSAQNNVSINNSGALPDPSAMLDVASTSKGFLVPRMDSSQIAAITTPANGLLVYNIEDNCFWYNKNSVWKTMCGDTINNSNSIDSVVIDKAYIDSVFANIIIADTLYSNIGYIDTLYSSKAYIDSLIAKFIQVDSLLATYIKTDTLYASVGYIDSLLSKYITVDTLLAQYGNFDSIFSSTVNTETLLIAGVPIDSIIKNMIDTTAWLLKGNTGTDATQNFIGTTDSVDWVIKTNNVERARVIAAGNVGIGTSTPDPSALVEMDATDKGILIPRTDTLLITSPATGLLIYQSSDSLFYYFDGVRWNPVGSGMGVSGNTAGNAYAVSGTIDDTVSVNTWTDMKEMTVTITPVKDTVYATFSASGYATTNSQQKVDFRIVKDGTPVQGFTQQTRGYSLFVSQDTVAWNASATIPILVTSGVASVIKVQWKMLSFNGSGAIRNWVATDPEMLSHRTLKIEE